MDEDRRVHAKGWDLVGAYQGGWQMLVNLSSSRPLQCTLRCHGAQHNCHNAHGEPNRFILSVSVESTLPDPLPRACSRIVLRRFALADLPVFQAYRHDKRLSRYQDWEPQSDLEASQFITVMSSVRLFQRGQWVQLGIADRRTNALIGDVGVCVTADGEKAEIGFTMDSSAQGMGLASEAVRAAISLIFDCTAVAQIIAVTDARNLPSIRLLERVGMRRIETVAATFRGEPCMEYVYAISKEEG